MSSFVCSAKHFNSAQQKLRDLIVWKDMFYIPYKLKDLLPKSYAKRHYSTETIEAELDKFFDTLRELNALCVSLQYKHHYEGRLDEEIKETTTYLMENKTEYQNLSVHGLYNALKCIGYQIETEHLQEIRQLTPEEENAMTILEELENTLARFIVYQLPDDTTNRWSIE